MIIICLNKIWQHPNLLANVIYRTCKILTKKFHNIKSINLISTELVNKCTLFEYHFYFGKYWYFKVEFIKDNNSFICEYFMCLEKRKSKGCLIKKTLFLNIEFYSYLQLIIDCWDITCTLHWQYLVSKPWNFSCHFGKYWFYAEQSTKCVLNM